MYFPQINNQLFKVSLKLSAMCHVVINHSFTSKVFCSFFDKEASKLFLKVMKVWNFPSAFWHIFTARIRRMGKVMFSQVSVPFEEEGVSHLNPLILPTTGPMSFPGDTPPPSHSTFTGPRSIPWGRGVPQSGQVPGQNGRRGYPPSRSGPKLEQRGDTYPRAPSL